MAISRFSRAAMAACALFLAAPVFAQATHAVPAVPGIGLKKWVVGTAVAGGAVYCDKRRQTADRDLMWVELQDEGVDLATLTPSCIQILTYKAAVSDAKKLRAALNGERAATGMPPDPDDCAAHHIVPANDNRKWAQKYVNAARQAIDGCVGINSAENGIYLPRGSKEAARKSADCEGSVHSKIHTEKYYAAISRELSDARDTDGCEGVRDALDSIKEQIRSGQL